MLGKHPRTEAEIKLMEGRYGAYVTDGDDQRDVAQVDREGCADAGGSRAADRRARGGGAGEEERQEGSGEEGGREEGAAAKKAAAAKK